MTKITLIVQWHGPLPTYFPLFLASCAHNPSIDFLFFSDVVAPGNLPPNVRFEHLSLDAFNELASRKIGLVTCARDAYKLCDFRPAYGIIFEDYLGDSDFWGSTDIDLILGNVQQSIDEALRNFDVISVRKEWHSGSFSLYRNRADVNNLFKLSRDFTKVFTDNQHYGFDECSRVPSGDGFKSAYALLARGIPIHKIETEVESMTHVLARSPVRVFRETLIAEGIGVNSVIEYVGGELLHHTGGRTTRPLHYHFVGEKLLHYFSYPNWPVVPERFFITTTGFYRERQFRWRRQLGLIRKFRGTARHALKNPARAMRKLLDSTHRVFGVNNPPHNGLG